MTIKECIDIVDNIKPNQYTIREKVMWLSFIDEIIINEVLKTHEGYDGRYDDFEGYSEVKLSVPLIVPSPYDRLYTAYLKMKIDGENGETARYNNSMALYNSYMMEYRRYYNKTHMPLNATSRREVMPPRKNSIGLSDAEYENLKRDVISALDDIVYENTSPDKINDVIAKYVSNNAEMLKGKDGNPGKDGEPGKDGYTPRKGKDYWTTEDKTQITNYINEQTEIIKSDVEGLQQQINEEAHFRGYCSTNAKIQAIEATPNDFAYSAESGTKWIYDAESGWQDTGTPVPDQLTPASDTTPLMNGTASKGSENAYARGDHRHPTDTTRASVKDLNDLEEKVAPFVVNVAVEDETHVTLDKDAGEIEQAYREGKPVLAYVEYLPGVGEIVAYKTIRVLTLVRNHGVNRFTFASVNGLSATYLWNEDELADFDGVVLDNGWRIETVNLSSKEYVDNKIGDIETALDNIITKYGLGGDVV